MSNATTFARALALLPLLRASLKSLLKDRKAKLWFRERGQYEHDEAGIVSFDRKFTKTVGDLVSEAIEDLRRDFRRFGYFLCEDRALTVADLGTGYADTASECGDCGVRWFESEDALNAVLADEKRAKLENAAASLAHEAGVKMNSLDFIVAVNRKLRSLRWHVESWNSGECRAERYAANPRVFFEDNDYVGGLQDRERDNLTAILEWLSEQCPLLWAKYEEAKLAGTLDPEGVPVEG